MKPLPFKYLPSYQHYNIRNAVELVLVSIRFILPYFNIDIKPGYKKRLKFNVGTKSLLSHKLVSGTYKMEAYTKGYTNKEHSIDINQHSSLR